MSAEEIVQILLVKVKEVGGQKAWAERHGCPVGVVGEVVRGVREPDERVLVPLGLRRVVVYEPIDR